MREIRVRVPLPVQLDDHELDERYAAYYGRRESAALKEIKSAGRWAFLGWLLPVACIAMVLIALARLAGWL